MADQELPNTAENRAFALDVITRIEANTGLKIRGFFEQDLAPDEIRHRMHASILGYVEARQAAEKTSPDWPLAGQMIDAREAIFGRSTTNVTPNIAVTEYNYNIIKSYRELALHDYVKRVTNGLSLLHEGMSAGEAAATILGSGIASFATAMIVGTVKALIQKQTLRAAVTAGVKAMGKMTVVVGVALVIITELLLYLIFANKKVFLGMVFNNTPLTLVVHNWRDGVSGANNNGDLYMNTGYMNAFMDTHMDDKLDSPLVQVMEKFDVADPEENIISGGIFNSEKKAGLFGTEGVMVLSSYTKDHSKALPRFALFFACPYSNSNGVNVRIDNQVITAKACFENLYPSRGQHKTATGGGYTFAASCSSPWGGDATGIATLDPA